jgi:hypothetical protein
MRHPVKTVCQPVKGEPRHGMVLSHGTDGLSRDPRTASSNCLPKIDVSGKDSEAVIDGAFRAVKPLHVPFLARVT